MQALVNIDGELLSPEQARVPIFDRGFLYGDSVYEVLRTYGGRLFERAAHLDRLAGSAKRLQLELPARPWLEAEIDRTLEAAGYPESYCRLIVTRGSGPVTLDPTTAERPRTVVLVKPYEPFPDWMFQRGIRVAIPGVRRNLRAAIDPAIKSGNYLNNVLALGEARRAGCDDALLLDAEGRVTEGSSSNVFVSRGGVLLTPALETGLLAGVTRALVLRLAGEAGLACRECELLPEELFSADEVMLTSTLREVMPVVELAGHPIGPGRPGPLAARLRQLVLNYATGRSTP